MLTQHNQEVTRYYDLKTKKGELINVGCGFILDYKVSSNISSPMIMWLYERIDNVTMTMNLGVGLEIEIMPDVVRSVFKFP
jgi:hypothetical protein